MLPLRLQKRELGYGNLFIPKSLWKGSVDSHPLIQTNIFKEKYMGLKCEWNRELYSRIEPIKKGLWWHSSEVWAGTVTILLGTLSLPLLTIMLPPWQVLKEKIDQLKLQGGNFDFAKHAPDVPKKKDTENRNKKTWPKERYQWPVMFFLFLFSFIVCSCCIIIMCWQHIDKFGDTWTNSLPGGNLRGHLLYILEKVNGENTWVLTYSLFHNYGQLSTTSC